MQPTIQINRVGREVMIKFTFALLVGEAGRRERRRHKWDGGWHRQGQRRRPLGQGRQGSGEGDGGLRDGNNRASGTAVSRTGTTRLRGRWHRGGGGGRRFGVEGTGQNFFFKCQRVRASSNYIGEGFHYRLNMSIGGEIVPSLLAQKIHRQ